MPSTEEIREHEAKYKINTMGAYPRDLRTPTKLGDLVVVSWSDHLRVIREATNTGYLNGVATSHSDAVKEAEQERDRIWQMRIEAGGYLLTLNQPTMDGLFKVNYDKGYADAKAAYEVPTGVWEEQSFDAGIDAAREAVAACDNGAWTHPGSRPGLAVYLSDALAAIDNLRSDNGVV